VHEEDILSAVLHEFPDSEVGEPFPPELLEREDPVDLEAVGMFLAPGDPDTPAVDEHPEDPVGSRVGLLLAVVFPDGFRERELVFFQFTGDGRHGEDSVWVNNPALSGNSKTNRYIFYPLIKAVERGMAVGKSWGAVVLIMTIVSLMSAGCSSLPGLQGQGGTPQGSGISDITPRNEFRQVSLDEAIGALNGTGTPGSVHIYYIRGEGVDINGSARTWTIGTIRQANPFFFVFSAKGSEVVNLSYPLPAQEIPINAIMSPGDLFSQHRLLIQDVTNNGKISLDNLEIRKGAYTLEVRSGNTTKMYLFDPVTGKDLAQE
jgi:hypothetical protein